MSLAKVKQQSLQLSEYDKRDLRTQFGALCWRKHRSEVQVLLVTSRRSKRWILPKGWPIDGSTPVEAAMEEAWEEAGVKGKSKPICVGLFSYTKELDGDSNLPCMVALFPVKVTSLANDWPEKSERKRRWFSLKKAASLVQEPELSSILKKFDPSVL